MYILLNRDNILIDILPNIRYIKLQNSNGIVVGCSEKEGTGVIGSDCNTHYTLIKSDLNSSKNAVKVLEVKEIPSNIVPNLYKYNLSTQQFEYIYSLEQAKELKQEENKKKFSEFLAAHPIVWTDEKEYGITLEDQSEISLNLTQYQLAVSTGTNVPTLEWHAKHEACQPWTLENLTSLSMAISAAVYPYYRKMQQYKILIYSATTVEELNNIQINYE